MALDDGAVPEAVNVAGVDLLVVEVAHLWTGPVARHALAVLVLLLGRAGAHAGAGADTVPSELTFCCAPPWLSASASARTQSSSEAITDLMACLVRPEVTALYDTSTMHT